MKFKFILSIVLLSSSLSLNAQITQKDFDDSYDELIQYLVDEDWSASDSLTTLLLNKINKVDSMAHEKEVLRYMSIYSTAGLLNEHKISKEDALKKVEKYKGKQLIMPAHPLIEKCYTNCTHVDKDRKNTFFTGVNNAAGTQIFSFEYVKMKKVINKKYIESLEGKNISLRGVLKSISIEGHMLPRFKMEFVDGELDVIE